MIVVRGHEAKSAKAERVSSAFQSQAIGFVNTMETLSQAEVTNNFGAGLSGFLESHGYHIGKGFHALWKETPTLEKRRLMQACQKFLGDAAVLEEWIELGQLASYVSQARARGDGLGEVNQAVMAKKSVVIEGGEEKEGYFKRPRREVYTKRVSANALVQAVDNLIANGQDAIDPENEIGMFASGVKVLEVLLGGQTGEIKVLSKVRGGESNVSRVRKSLGGRTYQNVVPLDQYPVGDLTDIPGESGTVVRITGISLTDEKIRETLDAIAFRSGTLGRGVTLEVDGQPRLSNRDHHFWGRNEKVKRSLGRIKVKISRDAIEVSDTGCGMTQEQLFKLFVPRQGTKSLSLLNESLGQEVVEQRGYLETVRRAKTGPRVILKRRTEVLKRIELDPERTGFFEGDVSLEFDAALRPAGEGRGQSGIYIDENLAVAIEQFAKKVLSENRPDEEKMAVISSLYETLAVLLAEQGGTEVATEATRIIKKTRLGLVKACRELLLGLSNKYFLIPNDPMYRKLVPGGGKPYLSAPKEILDHFGYFFIDSICRRLQHEDGVSTKGGFIVYAGKLGVARGIKWNEAFFKKLVKQKEDLLPVIIDTDLRKIIIDEVYWEGYQQLSRLVAAGQATDEQERILLACRQAMSGLMNKYVKTCYEVEGTHQVKMMVQLTDPKIRTEGAELGLATCTEKRGVYLDDIWEGTDRLTSFSGYERDLMADFVCRSDVFKRELKDDDVKEIKIVEQDGKQFVLAVSYTGVSVFSLDEAGEFHKLEGSIRKDKEARDMEMEVREVNGERILILLDIHGKKVGFYSLRELLEGRQLDASPMCPIADIYPEERLGEKVTAVLFDRGEPVIAVFHNRYAPRRNDVTFYRRNHEGVFVQSEKEKQIKTGFLAWMQVAKVNGQERLFYFDIQNEQYVAETRAFVNGELTLLSQRTVEVRGGASEAKLVYVDETPLFFASSYDGWIYPFRAEADGALTPLPGFQAFPEVEKRTVVRVADSDGRRLLLASSENANLALVRIDPLTGKFADKIVQRVIAVESTRGVGEIQAQFIGRLGGQSLMYYSQFHGGGLVDVVDGEKETMQRVLPPDYERRLALADQFEAILSEPSFAEYPEDAIREMIEYAFGHVQKTEDHARLVTAIETLASHPAMAEFFSPEMRQFVNSLPEDARESVVERSLVHLLDLARTECLPEKKSHCEYVLMGYYSWDKVFNVAYHRLLDDLEIEERLPLLDDRMRFYKVLADLCRTSRTVEGIEKLSKKLVKLGEMDLLMRVVDTLFMAYPEPRFGILTGHLDKLITPDKRDFYLYLTTDAEFVRQEQAPLTLDYNRSTPVSGLAYLGKVLGARSVAEMEEAVYRQYGLGLDDYLATAVDLSEFDQDWRIAVHFSGVNGVEQREIIQNADDAIRRRKLLYGENFNGRISYDYYTQEVNGENCFVQEIADNGCGMSDFARLCFAVSGLSDKGEFGASQSGEFGVGFKSNYKDNDIVVMDTVRVIDEATGRKGAAQDIYRVDRDESGYALRLIQVGSFENDNIDQGTELGTKLRLIKPASRGIPEIDALVAANTARKFGWLTMVTSLEQHADTQEIAVPITISKTVNEDGKGWKMAPIEIGYNYAGRVDLLSGKAITIYEGDGSVCEQVSLDGRWLAEIGPSVLELCHPSVRELVSKYHLVFNLHGFMPTLDRGSVLEGEEQRTAVAQLLTQFAAGKLLTDESYLPTGMPVDFRSMPWYVKVFAGVDPETKTLVKGLNNGAVLGAAEANYLAGRETDDFNFVLAALETDQGGRNSVLIERTAAFVTAYREKLAWANGAAKRQYRESLEETFGVARSVASDAMLAYLESPAVTKWFREAMRMIDVFDNVRSDEVVDVTQLYADTPHYRFIKELCAKLQIKTIKIVRGLTAAGFSFGGGNIIFSETAFNNPSSWPELFIHEPAHELERKLLELGIGSRYSHQQDGGFALAHKLVDWMYLDNLLAKA